GGNAPDGRKVKATIHWVSAEHALPVEARLYDYLFTKPDPDDVAEGKDWRSNLNPNSLASVEALVEPSVAGAAAGTRYQFERVGYFCVDPDSTKERPVFNRTVGLVDTYAKIEKAAQQPKGQKIGRASGRERGEAAGGAAARKDIAGE